MFEDYETSLYIKYIDCVGALFSRDAHSGQGCTYTSKISLALDRIGLLACNDMMS